MNQRFLRRLLNDANGKPHKNKLDKIPWRSSTTKRNPKSFLSSISALEATIICLCHQFRLDECVRQTKRRTFVESCILRMPIGSEKQNVTIDKIVNYWTKPDCKQQDSAHEVCPVCARCHGERRGLSMKTTVTEVLEPSAAWCRTRLLNSFVLHNSWKDSIISLQSSSFFHYARVHLTNRFGSTEFFPKNFFLLFLIA